MNSPAVRKAKNIFMKLLSLQVFKRFIVQPSLFFKLIKMLRTLASFKSMLRRLMQFLTHLR